MAAQVVTGAGFSIVGRNQKLGCGITMNLVATDKQGAEWLFDVSGAFTSRTAGLIRTDTMWKVLGRANVLHQLGATDRLVLLTTNLPKRGSVGDRALRTASCTFFDAVEMLPDESKARLRAYAQGDRQLPLPGLRSAEEIYRPVSLDATHGAKLAVPTASLGPIPGLRGKSVPLPHHIKVVLPSMTKDDKPIPGPVRLTAVRDIKAALGEAAGGCTTLDGKGSWVHPITGVQDEDVSLVESYSERPFDPAVVGAMVTTILTNLDQHTAAVVLNDVMYHYSADD